MRKKNPIFRVIGLIKVIPAPISSDWSYKSQIRKNDLLQILCFEKTENFFSANTPNFNFFPKFTQFSSDWSYSSRSRTKIFRVIGLITTHNSGLIATHVSGLITTPPCTINELLSEKFRNFYSLYLIENSYLACEKIHFEKMAYIVGIQ